MEIQAVFPKALRQHCIDPLSIFLVLKAHDKVICVSHEESPPFEAHLHFVGKPFVQHFMQVDIAQDWGYNAPYTKGNFEFQRVISFQRSPQKR